MNDDLVMISTTLKVAEKAKVIYEETPNYTKEELFADIGGALGLFLGFGSTLQWLVHDLVMLRNLPKGLNLLDVFVFSETVMRLSGQKMLEAMNYIFRGQLLKSHRLSRQRTKRHVKSRYLSNVRSYQANHHSFTCNRCLQAAYVELYN